MLAAGLGMRVSNRQQVNVDVLVFEQRGCSAQPGNLLLDRALRDPLVQVQSFDLLGRLAQALSISKLHEQGTRADDGFGSLVLDLPYFPLSKEHKHRRGQVLISTQQPTRATA